MENLLIRAAEIIKNSKYLIALTGAGISVESGIQDFRSAGGLWEKYDPMEYAHIDSFKKNPEKVWKMIFELIDVVGNIKPNAAHIALAKMENMNLLKAVITQNIDNLHQAAGSRKVIEFHGNARSLECLSCGEVYQADEIKIGNMPPRCTECDSILKPGFIFFGEAIPLQAIYESELLASTADAILVIGTSAIVYPAASIPFTAKANGAQVIEVNLESTPLTNSVTDVFLKGSASMVLSRLLEHL